MRKVELKPMEQRKYDIIKNLVDNNGNKQGASLKLGITIRQVNRLIIKYKEKGKESFIHGNKFTNKHRKISTELEKQIIHLFNEKYRDFNFKHFHEYLNSEECINISYTRLYKILDDNLILSPKSKRATRSKYKKRIQNKINLNKPLSVSEKKLIVENNILNPKDNHARISRKKYSGELIQMDASHHLWFGDTKTFLHAAIDDATGAIVGMYFDYQETLSGYYNVLNQIITNYGIPNELLTDRRTIFDYKSLKNPQPEYDTLTQFGYACDQLGITLSVTSVAQAKGRIERLFGTLQSRLINELKINDITNINQANDFLKTYIIKFNNQFSLINNNIPHVYEKLTNNLDLNLILAVVSKRVFGSGSSVKYKNKLFQAFDSRGNLVNFKNKTKTIIINSFDKKLYCLNNQKYYRLIELKTHETESKEFDKVKPKIKKKYSIPMSHPWKEQSYLNMLNRTSEKLRR